MCVVLSTFLGSMKNADINKTISSQSQHNIQIKYESENRTKSSGKGPLLEQILLT